MRPNRYGGGAYKNVLFCDNNRFCQEVIKKNFGKDVIIYGDIREVTADAESRQPRESAKQKGRSDTGGSGCDLLTGGFPCQPFSQAGKRKGKADDRYLWPEMLRVIHDFKPTWVIAENVRGLLTISEGLVFEQVCLDLEGEGYEVQPLIIPAVAVNAPHRRDRVWFVANKSGNRLSGRGSSVSLKEGLQQGPKSTGQLARGFEGPHSNAPDTESGSDRRHEREVATQGQPSCGSASWEQNWLEVATELCGVDDGLPAGLDGFKLSKAGHRVERLKALGNAIVPQVAIEIMRAIKWTQKSRSE
jgi:DNA (cytosine-5)-methyltransferase 1